MSTISFNNGYKEDFFMLSSKHSNHTQAINNLIASIALQESFFSDVICNETQLLILEESHLTSYITLKSAYQKFLMLFLGLKEFYKPKLNFSNLNFLNKKTSNLWRFSYLKICFSFK